MKQKALIVWGGWDGHEPAQVAEICRKTLAECDFEVVVSDTLDAYLDAEKMKDLSLIVSLWTMGEISDAQANAVLEAVDSGVGIAGSHGGMCDSFRNNVGWQFMTGGQWVAHPGNDGVEYTVNVKKGSSPITEGIADFVVKSEQYYMHVDPAIDVLATTRFPIAEGSHATNAPVDMPVVWTKRWGQGKVFYTSLGHHADVFDVPEALELMKRGFLWAAKEK